MSVTPDLILGKLKSVDKLKIKDIPFQNLAIFVRESTRLVNPIYVAVNTGISKACQIFKCRFHNHEYFCNSYIEFILKKIKGEKFDSKEETYLNKVINIKYDMIHNHTLDKIDQDSSRNTVSEEIRQIIIDGKKKNIPNSVIRTANQIYIPKNKYYEIIRPYQVDKYKNEFSNVIEYGKTLKDYNQVVLVHDNVYCGVYFFKRSIINTHYSADVMIVDDTMCTNDFNFPIIVAVTSDFNNKTQMLGFGVMEDKTYQSFYDFFFHLKQQMKRSFKVIVSDRSYAQMKAYTEIFPSANYIYCSRHLADNLEKTFGIGDMVDHFNLTITGYYDENQFIEELQAVLDNNNTEKVRAISRFISDAPHYLPSIIDNYKHFDNTTSNRIEGFFGTLKRNMRNNYSDILWVIQNIITISEMAVTSKVARNFPGTIVLLSPEDEDRLGAGALRVINENYEKVHLHHERKFCDCYKATGIPCSHVIKYRMEHLVPPLLTIDDFDDHWKKDVVIAEQSMPTEVEYKPRSTITSRKKSYNYYMEKYSRYFDIASRKKDVQELLDASLEKLKTLVEKEEEETKSNSEKIKEPAKLKIKGGKVQRPALLVNSKRKRIMDSKTAPHITKKPKSK